MARNDSGDESWAGLFFFVFLQITALPCTVLALVCLASALAAGAFNPPLGYAIGGAAAVLCCSATSSVVTTLAVGAPLRVDG